MSPRTEFNPNLSELWKEYPFKIWFHSQLSLLLHVLVPRFRRQTTIWCLGWWGCFWAPQNTKQGAKPWCAEGTLAVWGTRSSQAEIDKDKQIALFSGVCKCFVQEQGTGPVVKHSRFFSDRCRSILRCLVQSAPVMELVMDHDHRFLTKTFSLRQRQCHLVTTHLAKNNRPRTCLKNRELFGVDLRQLCSGPTENMLWHFLEST